MLFSLSPPHRSKEKLSGIVYTLSSLLGLQNPSSDYSGKKTRKKKSSGDFLHIVLSLSVTQEKREAVGTAKPIF